jgi:ubiquinone/menaquinone biosynthesis C-methylase UbiE
MATQQEIWEDIAPEWHKFKKLPAEKTVSFLKQCTGKVLDHGSGSGRNLMKIKKGKMYLVDFSEKMLKLAEKKAKKLKIKAEFIQADLIKLPFEDNFFDYAISVSAIHCIEGKANRKKAIKELYRVLKKGGKAKVGVWNVDSKRFNKKRGQEKWVGWRDKGKRHYYLHEEKEIHNLFKKAGFKLLGSKNSEMMINFIVEK